MKSYRNTIKKEKITKNLSHTIQLTSDEERLFLVVKYKSNYVIEKNFRNNYLGTAQLEKACQSLDTEEKVTQYLGLGENKNAK